MNHIFKIIFNKKNGNYIVVSEKSKNNVRGEYCDDQLAISIDPTIFKTKRVHIKEVKKTALSIAILFSMSTFMSHGAFAITYDGTSSQLVNTVAVGGNFNKLIGNDSALGFVEFNSNLPPTPVLTSNVVIEYSQGSAPNFVLAGYSAIDNASQVNNNSVSLNRGNINGDVYAGLLHSTNITPSMNCVVNPSTECPGKNFLLTLEDKVLSTSNNTISLGSNSAITVSGMVNAGSSQINIDNGSFVNGVYTDATVTQIDKINANTMQTNLNKVLVSGQNNEVNTVNIGNNTISVKSGDFTGGTSVDPGNAKAYVSAQSNVRTNKLYTNKNEMSVNGSNNKFFDINSGMNTISIDNGFFKAGTSESTNNFMYTGANSKVGSSNFIISSVLQSNENKVSILGNNNKTNNIEVGQNVISVKNASLEANQSKSYGSAYSFADYYSNLEKNTLNANQNTIQITGDNNKFENIIAGHNTFNIQVDNTTASHSQPLGLSAGQPSDYANATSITNISKNIIAQNNNVIEINGIGNKFNNIISGFADVDLLVGETNGGTYNESVGKARLVINANGLDIQANHNKVNLKGSSTVNGSINMGYIKFNIDHGQVKLENKTEITPIVYTNTAPTNVEDSYIDLRQTNAKATSNVMIIEGSHTFSNPNSTIYGGYLDYNDVKDYKPVSYDVFSGNTLKYANKTPISIDKVANFQFYEFTINPEFANLQTSLITANKIVLGGDSSNMSTPQPNLKSDISVTYISAGQLVKNNSEFILMSATALEGNGQGSVTRGVAQQGVSLVYDVDTFIRGNQVVAIVEGGPEDIGPETNPQLKALLEGNLSGLMLLTRNADNIADNMLNAIEEQNNKRGLVPFMIFNGNRTHYNTGSYIKSNGGSVTTGVSFQNSQLTGGLFMENGWDSYKTFNDFEDVKNVHGRGHNRFNGFGVYGHYDFINNWYLDGSVRGGKLKTNYVSDDIIHSDTKQRAEYEVNGNYYSVHLTGGYGYKWNENNNLDINLKYLWSGTEGHDIEIAGEQVKFNKLNSHRVRLSGENNYQLNKDIQLLAGFGYEYEFDGTAKGTALGTYNIEEPSVKGSTGIATLGIRYNPEMFKNFSMDLKASGYFGKREGGSALLHLKYAF